MGPGELPVVKNREDTSTEMTQPFAKLRKELKSTAVAA
jgi:hypothetical protein